MEKYSKLECRHFSDFKNECRDGVLTLKLTSWDEFHKVVKIFKNYTAYIWRGQRKKWPLKSSFDRDCDQKFSNSNERQNELDRILNEFKNKLQDLPNPKTFEDDEIWAIGQHYGLPTPLLDWTECPYIAAYFAFFKKGTNEETEDRVIYAVNKAVQRPLLKGKNVNKRFVKFLDLRHNLDKMQNERLKEQKGKFTESLNGDDIEINVERCSKKGKYNQKILLAKILIPDKFRVECLGFLESKKITHGTLFPDYAGAVEICKIELGIDKCDKLQKEPPTKSMHQTSG
jgi:hypothetical protein